MNIEEVSKLNSSVKDFGWPLLYIVAVMLFPFVAGGIVISLVVCSIADWTNKLFEKGVLRLLAG